MRRKLLVAALVALSVVMLCSAVFAAYPDKSVKLICPWGQGGGTDRVLRFLAAELEKHFGQPFVVENKTGGDGSVGHTAGSNAAPDGYTLTFVTFELATIHWMGIAPVNYQNFEFISLVNQDAANISVKADSQWKDLKEMFEAVKAKPGEYQFSGTAKAGVWDLARILLFNKAGLKADDVVWIPSTGVAAAIPELLGGHVDALCGSLAEMKAQLDSNEFRSLVVMSDARYPDFPNVPTAKECGYDVAYGTFRGLAAPKGTPIEIIKTIDDAVAKITASDSFKEFMSKNGFTIYYMDSAAFSAFAKQMDEENKTVMELGGYLNK